MNPKSGVLNSFDSGSYTATVHFPGDNKAYLGGIRVARNIAASEMTAGRRVAVIFFDENNTKESVLAAVYEDQ